MNDRQELTLNNATLPRENTYLGIVTAISVLVWLVIVVTIVPAFYAVMIGIFLWFASGLLVARLKADGVKVDERQLPELRAALAEVCERLGVKEVPELYVIQSEGMLNAFAARHSGRRFVVVYSDLLEAYGPDSPEIKFLLGHEVGHLKRNHIMKRIFLFPGMLVPLLGNAYSRACEASCDRYGALAAADADAAARAIMVLSGGKAAGKSMDSSAFAEQHARMRGFFVSWYELISGYPTMSQRVANMIAARDGLAPKRMPRHPLAYLFAFFTVGGRGTGAGNILVTVAIIGVLAAIAIPSFVKARESAQRAQCLANLRALDAAKEQAAIEQNLKDGAEIAQATLDKYIPAGGLGKLRCSRGGSYVANPAGQNPVCTIHGSLLDSSSWRRGPGRIERGE